MDCIQERQEQRQPFQAAAQRLQDLNSTMKLDQSVLLLMIVEQLCILNEQMAQANETDPDAEPDPFQTLNGPSIKAKVPVGYLK